MTILGQRVCESCVFRGGCPHARNKQAIGWCLETAVYIIYVIAVIMMLVGFTELVMQ